MTRDFYPRESLRHKLTELSIPWENHGMQALRGMIPVPLDGNAFDELDADVLAETLVYLIGKAIIKAPCKLDYQERGMVAPNHDLGAQRGQSGSVGAQGGESMTPVTPWQELLARSVDGNHIAQVYRDETFLMEAASHFVGAGLRQGEGVIVIATTEHWEAFARRLKADGLNVRKATWRGQLRILDAAHTLSQFMMNGMPDWKAFQDVVGNAINQARWQYAKVRAFGEMVNILRQRGDRVAAARLEAFWNYFVNVQNLSFLCAHRMDPLSEDAYGGALESVCEMHSHLIPARDYDRLEEAVNQAGKDVLGKRLAGMLQSLAGAHRPSAEMPPAQATLLWLNENMPLTANKILSRVRAYCYGTSPGHS